MLRLEQLRAEEQELEEECSAVEQQLRQDALCFENEALEVQLQQIQDDHLQLQEELRNTCEFYGRRIEEFESQLEERARASRTAEGHADCLKELLLFHEENGEISEAYWRVQCVKRDDSIRFLTLKLQEYTQRRGDPSPSSFNNQAAYKATERALHDLQERHSELCQEFREGVPAWALRCSWREELDILATQLERSSASFDQAKRALDAAKEELNWHATGAEALKTRLADVRRATAAEQRRSEEVMAEELRRKEALRSLVNRWKQLRPTDDLPAACAHAQSLLQ